MKKLRYYIAVIVLAAATLGGPFFLQAMGSGSLANAASNRHTSSISASSVAGKSTGSVALKRTPPCPVFGHDC